MGCNVSRCGSGVRQVDIRDVYYLGEVLGSGAFGQVRSCTRRDSKEQFAVKIMSKKPSVKKRGGNTADFCSMFENEVSVLQTLKHPNIIRYYEVYEDRHFLYAVMDKCEGGELFAKAKGHFSEKDVCRICKEMLKSIVYLHGRMVVHRDIKAQNFLFQSKNDKSSLILIDFGMATRISHCEYLTRLCGSPHYVSPDLVNRRYQWGVDMWALGVIVYLMIYGRYPFEGSNRDAIMEKVTSLEPQFPPGPSEHVIDFLQKTLSKDPLDRLSSEKAAEHPWILMSGDTVELGPDVERSVQRKLTMEKNAALGMEIEKRLSKIDHKYEKGHSTGRKISVEKSNGIIDLRKKSSHPRRMMVERIFKEEGKTDLPNCTTSVANNNVTGNTPSYPRPTDHPSSNDTPTTNHLTSTNDPSRLNFGASSIKMPSDPNHQSSQKPQNVEPNSEAHTYGKMGYDTCRDDKDNLPLVDGVVVDSNYSHVEACE